MIDYTPRQAAAFLEIAKHRISVEKADKLHLDMIAARGKPEYVNGQIRRLTRGVR